MCCKWVFFCLSKEIVRHFISIFCHFHFILLICFILLSNERYYDASNEIIFNIWSLNVYHPFCSYVVLLTLCIECVQPSSLPIKSTLISFHVNVKNSTFMTPNALVAFSAMDVVLVEHIPGSSIQKSVQFLPLIKWFNFSIYSEATESWFFYRLNSEIYLYHRYVPSF